MGRVFLVELEGRSYRCRYCHSPLALADDVVSRSFNCSRGRAYLFNNAVNVSVGPTEERTMLSGLHTVSDVFCCCCGQILGWKYVTAYDKPQKYKEGKFVLERWRIAEEVTDEVNLDARLALSDAENAQ
ncbi:protein yippee-like At5g53940 [Rhododendron vialii]|uniref:protein yippee-like At5g53940 n=1 Tax=Rhododendron vialii TaxID=182163 RepID=UPI00265FCD25|nr:protein yippee-like At5g53940 [Rhododendron vialii]XP_058199310.1 protein yippee-like At5g53940 [Rhododendron vialii]XP_058199319.1 protein yippee-like At5g53940 [Rhododendron vialii]